MLPTPRADKGPIPEQPWLLGLDAGGSSTRWSLWQGSMEVACGVAPPLTAHLLQTPDGQATLESLVCGLPTRPDAVWAGVSGLGARSSRAAEVAAQLASALGVSAAHVHVESDLDLAYRAHWRPGEGVLVYAGTGSIAYHVSASGEVVRAGGRGPLLGDEGGGFSLGRAALRVMTEALDRGDMAGGALAEEVAAVTGGLDWDTLRAFAYASPGTAAIARLAPAVGRAANRGDGQAQRMLEEAARSLAELAARVLDRTGPLPVVVTGGALRVSPLFSQALSRELPQARMQERDHAAAAARAASELLTGC